MELDKWVGPYKVRAFPWTDGTRIYFNVRYYTPGQSLEQPPVLDRTVYITNDDAGQRMVFEFTDTLVRYVAESLKPAEQQENKIVITVGGGPPDLSTINERKCKMPYRNELPDTCLSVLPSTGQLIIIKNGESGYYPSEWDTGNREENRKIASSHNARRGISDIQESAMLTGSMFGWDVPGAHPQWYLDNAKYVNSHMAQGHIKDPLMSIYYPVKGFLLHYEIMGKQKLYLPMSDLPKELMGMNTQFVMQPDLVRGMPVMPVKAAFAENGSCTVELERDSYVVGGIINSDYQITARVRVGSAEFVIGEYDKAPDPFVTWERNCKNDGDGSPNYFWGHYGTDRVSTIEDFCQRANREYKIQKERQAQREKKRAAPKKERGDAR